MKYTIMLIIAVMAVLLSTAEAATVWGANGEYLGQAQTSGNVTNYYGADGNYRGSAQVNNSQTDYYGANGNYQGTVGAPVYVEPSRPSTYNIVPQAPQARQVRSY